MQFLACLIVRTDLWCIPRWFIARFQPRKSRHGNISLPFIKRRQKRNFQVLAYHRVNDDGDYLFPAVPLRLFEEQMKLLTDCFDVRTLTELVEACKCNELPENAVAVTFDDGYRDNYTNAFPILRRYSVPATICLATDVIGTGAQLWHDDVFAAFRETRIPKLPDIGLGLPPLPLTSAAAKLCAQVKVLKHLRSLENSARELAVGRLRNALHVKDKDCRVDSERLMLNWEEVAEMCRNGVEFAAHTGSHPALSKLRPEMAREEIRRSKGIIERWLNVSVKTFAYPRGRREDFTGTTRALIEEAGFDCALTTIFGNNEPGMDLYEIRRISPWNENAESFVARLGYYKFSA